MEADDVDVVEAQAVLRGEGGHRLGMGRGDDPLGLAQAARPRGAIRQVGSLVQRLAQHAALRVGIGAVSGRPEGVHLAAVGLDQSDIDPVNGSRKQLQIQ